MGGHWAPGRGRAAWPLPRLTVRHQA